MREWLLAQTPSGIEILIALQQWQTPALNAIMKAITDLGSAELALLVVPIILWCVDKEFGVRLIYAYLGVSYVNSALKALFHIPRPFSQVFKDFNAKLHPLRGEDSFSWPSGHAQNAVVVWGYTAYRVHRRWVQVLAVLIVLLIGFSRMYVGVHTPIDVLGGWAAGVLCLVGGIWIEPRLAERWRRLSFVHQLLIAVVVPVLLTLVAYSPAITMTTGALLGLSVGFVCEARYVRFAVQGVWWKRLLRGLTGLALLLPIYLGLKAFMPEAGALWPRLARYAVIGLAMAFGAPWLFVRVGLAAREERE